MERMGNSEQFHSVGCKRKKHCFAHSSFLAINGEIHDVGAASGSNTKRKYNGDCYKKLK